VGRSFEKAQLADVILFIYDQSAEDEQAIKTITQWLDSFQKPFLLVANKSDLSAGNKFINPALTAKILPLSAKEKSGVDALKKALFEITVHGNTNTESTIVTNSRHYEALQKLHTALLEVRKGLAENITGDLLSLDIRSCLYYLGEITGEITNEDQLDYIFSKFCIGK
jgi:tRNA modification GTPase